MFGDNELKGIPLFLLIFSFLCWDGDKWNSITRDEILRIAREMIETPWSPSKICRGWNPAVEPPEYYPSSTYFGILYSQDNPQENFSEFLKGVNNLPYDYYGYWGASNRWYNYYGNDCSGFVSICWRMPSRNTTTTFHNDANGNKKYCYPLGPKGSAISVNLLPGDALNSAGSHIILFSHKSSSNTIVSLEQTPNNAKTRTWYYSSLQDYQPIRRNMIIEKKEHEKERVREKINKEGKGKKDEQEELSSLIKSFFKQ